jgi:SAM-dependent methyltransferase
MISPKTYQSFVDTPELAAFLDHVFKQVDTQKFMRIYREAVQPNSSTQEIYEKMYNRAGEAKEGFFAQIFIGLNALKQEIKTLGENIAKIVDPRRVKNGYIEIGLPGRMIETLKAKAALKGNITVLNEQESVAQSGFPKPYHRFERLTYDPIRASKESVDLISCFAGLHHCPPEKLEKFIASIHDALAPGGIFLLRDHDARTEKLADLSAVIHSVFNAASGVGPGEEEVEVRNFKPNEEWVSLLKKQGLHLVSSPHFRQGDPSENGLMKFIKLDPKDELQIVREHLINIQPRYTRRSLGKTLTAVEWFILESSQNLGKYKDFWDYPYFRDCAELWKTLVNSYRAAAKSEEKSKILFSDYTVMNSVLTSLATGEFLVKGVLSFPLWAIAQLKGKLIHKVTDPIWAKPSETYQAFMKQYGDRLETTTFYAQSYVPHIKNSWKELFQKWSEVRKNRSVTHLIGDSQSVKNVVTNVAMTSDLLFRAAVGTTINAWFGGEAQADDRTIGVIVKRLNVSEKNTPYEGVVLPRYKQLAQSLKEMTANGVEICELAGQKEVQIDLVVEKNSQEFKGDLLYERAYLPDSDKKIIVLNVKVNELGRFLHHQGFHRLYDF